MNRQITNDTVRLIDEDGNMMGIMPTDQAIEHAKNRGLDLVEISPNAAPPVCKALDFGKYRYEAQKKAKLAKKNQKVTQVKEVKVRLNIDTHDYEVKLRNAHRFLENKDKVKVSMRFRGREITQMDLAKELMQRFIDDTAELSRVELAPKMEGRQMVLILAPQ